MASSSEFESTSNSSPKRGAQDFSHLNENNFPLARYKPLKLLGKGTTGAVYLCDDKKLEKKVALKTAHGLTASHLFDFQREARATSKLNHPNIVQIFDCGITANSIPYITMEPIEGKSLDDYLQEGIIFELDTIIEIFIKVTEALTYAHEHGIYHRDLKPGNILILGDEENLDVKIIDFGVAHMVNIDKEPTVIQGVTITGTPLYMSPDQVNNLPYNATSEVYSLGCILYEALTGKSPYEAPTSLELFSCHAMRDIPRLSEKSGEIKYPEMLEGLVAKCMAKEQSARFQTMREVRSALKRCLYVVENADKETARPPEPEDEQLQRVEKKLKVKSVVFTALPVVLVGGLVLAFILSQTYNKTTKQKAAPQVISEELPDSLEDFGDRWYTGKNERGEDALFAKSGTTDSDLKALQYTEPSRLTRIIIPYSSKITGTGFKYLKKQPIIGITFKNRSLTDAGLKEVSQIDSLLGVVLVLANKITSKGLKYLNNSPRLVFLYIGAMKLEPDMIATIAENQKLKALGMMLCKVSDPQSLLKLGNLKELLVLEIPGTGAEDITFVRGMKKLHKLNLAYTRIDDSDIDSIVELPLKELSIQNTAVSITGLSKLNKIKTLKKLKLSLGNGITRKSIKQNLTLPNCVVDIQKRKRFPRNRDKQRL